MDMTTTINSEPKTLYGGTLPIDSAGKEQLFRTLVSWLDPTRQASDRKALT